MFCGGEGYAIEVAFVVEVGFLNEARILGVGRGFRCPSQKFLCESRLPQLRDVDVENAAGIGGHVMKQYAEHFVADWNFAGGPMPHGERQDSGEGNNDRG